MPLLKRKKNKKRKLSQKRNLHVVNGLATRKNKIKTRKKNKHNKLAGMLSFIRGRFSTRKCKTESSESGPSYEVCAICSDQMLPSQQTTMFMCNHRFHTNPCYTTLLAYNDTRCPICRANIKLVGDKILETNEQLERAKMHTEKNKNVKVHYRDPTGPILRRDILLGSKKIEEYERQLAELIEFREKQEEKVRSENQQITEELETLEKLETQKKLETLETQKSKKKSSKLYPSMLMPTGETAPDDGSKTGVQKLN